MFQGANFVSSSIASFAGGLGASGWGSVVGTSGVSMIGFATLAGGIGAKLTGGNFWEGALIGGVVATLNHEMHKMDGADGITQDQKDDPEFFSRLKARYESQKGGKFNLAKEEFQFLASKGKIHYQNAKLIDAKNNIYEASINFYDSGFDLANTFGKATVTYRVVNGKPLFRSFYDTYNFDPKPWGTRSTINEIKTRAYNVYSSGKAFEINYNQNYLRK